GDAIRVPAQAVLDLTLGRSVRPGLSPAFIENCLVAYRQGVECLFADIQYLFPIVRLQGEVFAQFLPDGFVQEGELLLLFTLFKNLVDIWVQRVVPDGLDVDFAGNSVSQFHDGLRSIVRCVTVESGWL